VRASLKFYSFFSQTVSNKDSALFLVALLNGFTKLDWSWDPVLITKFVRIPTSPNFEAAELFKAGSISRIDWHISKYPASSLSAELCFDSDTFFIKMPWIYLMVSMPLLSISS
jgi:hypothetical protein